MFLFIYTEWQSKLVGLVGHLYLEGIVLLGLMLLTLFSKYRRSTLLSFSLTLTTLIAVGIGSWTVSQQNLLDGVIKIGSLYQKFVLLGAIANILVTLLNKDKEQEPEFYIAVLSSQLAVQVLGMSRHLLVSFIGFELLSIAGYMLVSGQGRKHLSSESALKFIVYGAFSSAVMVYGLSLMYGKTQTLFLGTKWEGGEWELISQGLIWAGLLFKLHVVPFHVWAPDIYQGTRAPAAQWLSTTSKLGAVAFFIAFYEHGMPSNAQALLILLTSLTLFIANLGILRQQYLYRMVAYSSVSHSGFLLLPLLLLPTTQALNAALYYLWAQIVLSALFLFALDKLEPLNGNPLLEHLQGIGKVKMFEAISISGGLAGLIGLPPTIGFFAKLFALMPLWKAYQTSGDNILLIAMISFVLATILALAAYSRIWIMIFLREPAPNLDLKTPLTITDRVLLIVLLGLSVVPFFF